MNGTDRKGRQARFRLLRLFFALCLLLAFSRSPVSGQTPDQRININTASAEELTQLPGIGPASAAHIVAHRQKHGRFKRAQDIIVVRGMSAGRYRQIAALIRI